MLLSIVFVRWWGYTALLRGVDVLRQDHARELYTNKVTTVNWTFVFWEKSLAEVRLSGSNH